MSRQILVTGITGFVGSHCALDLLTNGYRVRGTVRQIDRAEAIRQTLRNAGADVGQLEFAEASLDSAEGWDGALAGCDGVFHVASPVPTVQPKHADEVIQPAVQGTTHVLEAAQQQGIRRIILTSSVAAILGSKPETRQFTAADWSDVADPGMTPYALSKTLAERAAWDMAEKHQLELVTINPAMILGPALEADYGSSLVAIIKLMRREIPMFPRFGTGIVDVRDVASLHRIAWEQNDATGQRLIAANGFRWFSDIAAILQEHYPAYRIPRTEIPAWLTRLAGLFIPEISTIINDIDCVKDLDNSPALALGWQPRTPEEAITSGADSLVRMGVV